MMFSELKCHFLVQLRMVPTLATGNLLQVHCQTMSTILHTLYFSLHISSAVILYVKQTFITMKQLADYVCVGRNRKKIQNALRGI